MSTNQRAPPSLCGRQASPLWRALYRQWGPSSQATLQLRAHTQAVGGAGILGRGGPAPGSERGSDTEHHQNGEPSQVEQNCLLLRIFPKTSKAQM